MVRNWNFWVTMMPEFRRGDIVWLDCEPSIGVEPKKTRTCVVVSNDGANTHGAANTVVPTLKYQKDRADRIYMVDLRKPRSTLVENRVANASFVMTYDRHRVVKLAGRVHADALKQLNQALKIHLDLGD